MILSLILDAARFLISFKTERVVEFINVSVFLGGCIRKKETVFGQVELCTLQEQ